MDRLKRAAEMTSVKTLTAHHFHSTVHPLNLMHSVGITSRLSVIILVITGMDYQLESSVSADGS